MIIHHLDFETKSLKNNICEYYGHLVLKTYPKDIKIVVVSEIWKDYMIKRGFSNVTIIKFFSKEFIRKSNFRLSIKQEFDYKGIKRIYLGGARREKVG